MLEYLQEDTRFFITGHTGFKGTWLTLLLRELGFSVFGYSLKEPDFFLSRSVNISSICKSSFGDIRSRSALSVAMTKAKPNVVVHLAAQPLVLESYRQPAMTFEVNVQGTVNVLEIASQIDTVHTVLIITTDKVYRNDNQGKRFTEEDSLFGTDPYSCSKVATEAAAKAWQGISKLAMKPKVLVARAGNVIGGGDLSLDRLIPDIVREVQGEPKGVIRNPDATRPWQHVLEPLIGYLRYIDESIQTEVPNVLNFGPMEPSISVREVIRVASEFFDLSQLRVVDEGRSNLESTFLDLDSTLAKTTISWVPKWSQIDSIVRTFSWWRSVLNDGTDVLSACQSDINARLSL